MGGHTKMNWNRVAKYAAGTALAAATVLGTFSNHQSDLAPLQVKKVGVSGGICVGGNVQIEPGAKFYGIILAGAVNNKGEIYGSSIGLANAPVSGKLRGLELSLFNSGLEEEYPNRTTTSSDILGLQIGLINSAKKLRGVQIGVYNTSGTGSERKSSILLDYDSGNGAH